MGNTGNKLEMQIFAVTLKTSFHAQRSLMLWHQCVPSFLTPHLQHVVKLMILDVFVVV